MFKNLCVEGTLVLSTLSAASSSTSNLFQPQIYQHLMPSFSLPTFIMRMFFIFSCAEKEKNTENSRNLIEFLIYSFLVTFFFEILNFPKLQSPCLFSYWQVFQQPVELTNKVRQQQLNAGREWWLGFATWWHVFFCKLDMEYFSTVST
jgi:hypothetical protein